MLFDPIGEPRKALEHDGVYPTIEVSADKLLPKFQADSYKDMVSRIEKYKGALQTNANRQADRVFACECICRVYEQSLCAHTEFNPEGLGAPLLVSNTPSAISAGGLKKGGKWSTKDTWPNDCEELANSKLRNLFAMIKGSEDVVRTRTMATLDALCEHVFSMSKTPVVENMEFRVAESNAERQGTLMIDLIEDDDDELDDDSILEIASDGEAEVDGEDESLDEDEMSDSE
jgi:hypothetical protein